MRKIEELQCLQNELSNISQKIQVLEAEIKMVLNYIELDQFIPADLSNEMIECLECIGELQRNFTDHFLMLNIESKCPEMMEDMRLILQQKEKELLERDQIIGYVSRFKRLHSEDTVVEEFLKKHCEYLEQYNRE